MAQVIRKVGEVGVLRTVLGAALIIMGVLVLFIEFTALVSGSYLAAFEGVEEEYWSTYRIIRRVILFLLPLGVIYAGLVLMESKKLSVLYLRRFRLNVNVIDPRSKGGLGRSIRLITLEDGKFRPSGVPGRDAWLSRLAPAAAVAVALLIAASYAGRGPIWELNEAPRYALVRAMSFETGIALFVLVSLALHLYVATRRSKILVESEEELSVAVQITQSAAKWWNRPALFGRQATTISVADAVWQSAVKRLSHSVHAVVVDVSDRSTHVAWELDHLMAENVPHVLIAETGASGGNTPDSGVIQYDLSKPEELQKFRSDVGSALEFIARAPSRSQLTRKEGRRLRLRLTLIYLGIFALAASAAGLVAGLAVQPLMSLLYSG